MANIRIESPSNPLLGVADLPALIAAGHKAGATVLIDSTFTTPLLQRPLDLGADIAMHSVTKYIGGHSDLLMGALVASDPARIEVNCHANAAGHWFLSFSQAEKLIGPSLTLLRKFLLAPEVEAS